jgi:hypothetical protein
MNTPALPPPAYTDRLVVKTRVSTGWVLTARVAKSWHFKTAREMAQFQRRHGISARVSL